MGFPSVYSSAISTPIAWAMSRALRHASRRRPAHVGSVHAVKRSAIAIP
jgi:hypothetical protein